jgi:hypothetical protein
MRLKVGRNEPILLQPLAFGVERLGATWKGPQDRALHRREIRCPLAVVGRLNVGTAMNVELAQGVEVEFFPVEAFRRAVWRNHDLHGDHRGLRMMFRRGRSTSKSSSAV